MDDAKLGGVVNISENRANTKRAKRLQIQERNE